MPEISVAWAFFCPRCCNAAQRSHTVLGAGLLRPRPSWGPPTLLGPCPAVCPPLPAQVTGVRIHSEPSGELPTGQGLRRVTLAGSIDAVQYAQWMLGQRLAAGLHAATVQMRGGPPGAAAAGLPPGGYFIAAYPAGAAAGMTAPGLAHNHREVVGHGPAAFPVGAHLHAQLAAAVGHGQAQHFAAAAHGPAGGYPRPVQLQAGPQTRSGLAGEEPGHGWGGESGGGGSSRGRWA